MSMQKQQVSYIGLDIFQFPLTNYQAISIHNETNRVMPDTTPVYINWPTNDNNINLRSHDLNEMNVTSLTKLIMTITCGIIMFGGVFGNITLVLMLYSKHSVRLRNPLLLAVCIADLVVTGISAPLTLLNVTLSHKINSILYERCQTIPFMQTVPVAASTLSFFLLSLDRYATVKLTRLSQLRQRRYLHCLLAICSWIISTLVNIPFLFIDRTFSKGDIANVRKQFDNKSTMSSEANFESGLLTQSINDDCYPDVFYANSLFATFMLFHTIIVYILPGLGVLFNHYGVRQQLCALSLIARAAHGELPLPMPILRRKTYMVLVTGILKVNQTDYRGKVCRDDTSSVVDMQMHTLHSYNNCNTTAMQSVSPRSKRKVRAHKQCQRVMYNRRKFSHEHRVAAPGIPLPRTSTLKSRRYIANLLMVSALLFIICWTPHVFCTIYKNLYHQHLCSKTLSYFNLLLGYTYSVINPIIYCILNYNSLRQSPWTSLIRLRSLHRFLNSRFRSHVQTPPIPSSTNEAALGAFNPQLIKLTPKQYKTRPSSNYLY